MRPRVCRRRTLALGLVVLASGGCTTTATLSTRTGNLEARILGGDAETLVVEAESGVTLAVPRRDIREIDHPGNTVAVVGGVLAGVGALDLGILYSSCKNGSAAPCIAAGALAAAGAGMLTWGLWAWLRSRFAVDPRLGAVPAAREPAFWPPVAPAAVPSPPFPTEVLPPPPL